MGIRENLAGYICTFRMGKLIYDFLSVINSNLPSILHRFQLSYGQIFASESGVSHFNALLPISP